MGGRSMLAEAIGMGTGEMITLVGAGGKTSLAFSLAGELLGRGSTLLVTTTTKIYYPRESFTYVYTNEKGEFESQLIKDLASRGVPVLGTSLLSHQKIKGLEPHRVDRIFSWGLVEHLIVEADGAARKPIKLPAKHEPPVPSKTTIVLGLVGMDAVGKPLNHSNFHRAEIACREMGYSYGQPIDEDMVSRIVNWREGLFKGTPPGARKVLVLNKVDGPEEKITARRIAARVAQAGKSGYIIPERIVFSSHIFGRPRAEVFI